MPDNWEEFARLANEETCRGMEVLCKEYERWRIRREYWKTGLTIGGCLLFLCALLWLALCAGCVSPGAVDADADLSQLKSIVEQVAANVAALSVAGTASTESGPAVGTGAVTGDVGGDGDSVVSWVLAAGVLFNLLYAQYAAWRARRRAVEEAVPRGAEYYRDVLRPERLVREAVDKADAEKGEQAWDESIALLRAKKVADAAAREAGQKP